MSNILGFDYYYGIESEQFSFYRVPRLLVKDKRFKGLSSDAKLLYGLMLDRMSLSMKNEWVDEENRAYIIYAIESIMDDLGCSKPTCIKIMRELDSENGIGLIEKKRRGLGKPDIIYVKNFATIQEKMVRKDPSNADVSTEVKDFYFKKKRNFTSESKENELQGVKEFDFKRERYFTSVSKEVELQQVKDFDPNYTNINYTNINYTNKSYIDINQSIDKKRIDRMDEEAEAYISIIKDNIEYEHFSQHAEWRDKALYEELFEIICDIVCVARKTVKIGGEDYPYMLVKSKFLKLNSSHVQYVINSMHNTSSKINNIRAYMLTALYNAPNTMNHYYQQEVQHDMIENRYVGCE